MKISQRETLTFHFWSDTEGIESDFSIHIFSWTVLCIFVLTYGREWKWNEWVLTEKQTVVT